MSDDLPRYRTVTPYLVVHEVDRLIAFLGDAFEATTRLRLERKDGSVMHAQVEIGDSLVMMGEPTDEFEAMPGSIYLSVEECDSLYERALEAGGLSVMEPTDMVHEGERYGGVKDPSGNIWWIAMHLEALDEAEQQRPIDAGLAPEPGEFSGED